MDSNEQQEEQYKEFSDSVGIAKDVESDRTSSFSPSPFLEDYLRIMKPSVPIDHGRCIDQLKAAGIETTARHCAAEISILDFKFSSHYEVMELKVKLGKYVLEINLINIEGSSPLHGSCFQEGNFGKLYKYRSQEGVLKAVKCLQILDPEMLEKQLLSVLLEYSFLKISSALECGPKVQLGSFNIFLYLGNHENQRHEEKSCIEFQMELCESRQMTSDDFQLLMATLATLHRAGITHNDIKPPNILFSKVFRKWVFLDYGVSLCPLEEPGYETDTFFRGTLKYAGPQMRALYPNQQGLVDLYWNDVIGLQKCGKDDFLQEKQEELAEQSSQINEHFLMLKLKFNLYFSNVAEVIRLTASLKWNQKVKTTLFYFFQQISYLPSDLKLHFERVTSWEEISSMESLDPSKMFGKITSDLDFESHNLNWSPKVSRKEVFKRVYAGVLGIKKDRLKNQYLKDISSEKGKEIVIAILSNKEEAKNLQLSTHVQLLFEIVNFTESFSFNGYPIELHKKEKLCQIFEEVDRARTQANQEKLLPKCLESTLYFIKRALQEALKCPQGPLGSIIVPVYINYLMLGLAETRLITSVYEVLPTLKSDVGKVCDAFYLIHLNRCWFQKSVNLTNSIDLLEVRRSAVSAMEGIASKIGGYSSAHHCGELCEQREYDLLKLIYGCSEKAGHSYGSLQNRLRSCKLVLSILKHNIQMKSEEGEVAPGHGTRYRSWEIPLNLPELLNEVILNINSETYLTTTRHVEELMDCRAVTSSWLASMISEIIVHLEGARQTGQNCVVPMLRLYESYEKPVPNGIFYLICYYYVRRYLVKYYFLLEAGTTKANQLALDCEAVIMLMGNNLSVPDIVDYLLHLPIQESIAVWWYLHETRGERQRISMVAELYLEKLSNGQCPSKRQLKGLQFNIFRHVFLEDWEQWSEEEKMRVDTLIFGGEGNLQANYLQLRYLEYSIYDCVERFGCNISNNPRYQQVFSFLEGVFKKETRCWEYFITGVIRTYVFEYFLYYLLASNRNDTILWFLEEITHKMFRYYSRQINYNLFQLRIQIFNFFMFEYPTPPEGVGPLMKQMPFSHLTFQLMSIFLVYIDLSIYSFRSSVFSIRSQFPGVSTQRLLYCALQLQDEVRSNLKLQDIQLFYRCLLMMSSLRGFPHMLNVDERIYNHICRNHKKTIERLLSSGIYCREKKFELHYYARSYNINIAIRRKKDQFHPDQKDKFFIRKFKEMLGRYYYHQARYNRFHVMTLQRRKRQPRPAAQPKRMLPLFD